MMADVQNAPIDEVLAPGAPAISVGALAEERVSVATQRQLMWRRFRKHRVAVIGSVVVLLAYLIVIFADFLAYSPSEASDAQLSLIAPQSIRLFDNGFHPYVYALEGKRDPKTFQRVYTPNPDKKIPVSFFARGFEYKILGIIPTDRHLLGIADTTGTDRSLSLLGTDVQRRDVWSRLMFATRISMTIGLVSVVLSLLLGVFLGGLSGFYGGKTDTVIQRVIEIFRSIPTIPLWMGLAAAVPKDWSVLQVYFVITIIISMIGWTGLARVVRGRFLSLRDEDFVMAAELAGSGRMRIIFVHMVPLVLSYIIAATTLALPAMIISETSLSFLGLGLRPPAVSWGVMLQQAQNIQAIVVSPWLLVPAIPVIIVILAFNFLGDGLRDAADPYGV